jgi:hypothetical protein
MASPVILNSTTGRGAMTTDAGRRTSAAFTTLGAAAASLAEARKLLGLRDPAVPPRPLRSNPTHHPHRGHELT